MKRYCWLIFLFLGSCKVGPSYQKPEFEIPDAWTQNFEDKTPIIKNFWEQYSDPLLNQYIEKAKNENLDLLMAETKILRARATRQISASQLFPQVVADLNGTKTYFSKNGPVFAIGQASGNSAVTSSPLTALPYSIQVPQVQNLFNALFDVSWELDLFGKTRRAIERDVAYIEATMEEKNAMALVVISEIVKAYMELRSFQSKMEIQEKVIENFEQTLCLVILQKNEGLVSLIDVETIEKDLAFAKSEYPSMIAEIYHRIFMLSILLGELPETLVEELWTVKPIPETPQNIALGLRSDLVRQRPDVRKVERDLAAATFEIGVNVANFFPTISLLGTGGFQSLLFPKLFNWGSKTWAYGSDISMPVFQGGRLIGNLHLSQAEEALAAYNYQKVILTALGEAESALIFFKESQKILENINVYTYKSLDIFNLTKLRQQEGLVDILHVLSKERELLQSQKQLVDSKLSVLISSISLYKSLGCDIF